MLGAGARSARAFSAVVKRSTGLVGLDVVPNARAVLDALYRKTLEDVQVIPAHVPYRQMVEDFTSYRLGVVRMVEDVRWCSPPRARARARAVEAAAQAAARAHLIRRLPTAVGVSGAAAFATFERAGVVAPLSTRLPPPPSLQRRSTRSRRRLTRGRLSS